MEVVWTRNFKGYKNKVDNGRSCVGRAEVALTAARKGLRERISTNRIYCSLKERCKERMRVGGGGGWDGGCWRLRVSGRQKGRCKLLAAGVQMEIERLGQPTKGVRKKEEQKENPIVHMSKSSQQSFQLPPFIFSSNRQTGWNPLWSAERPRPLQHVGQLGFYRAKMTFHRRSERLITQGLWVNRVSFTNTIFNPTPVCLNHPHCLLDEMDFDCFLSIIDTLLPTTTPPPSVCEALAAVIAAKQRKLLGANRWILTLTIKKQLKTIKYHWKISWVMKINKTIFKKSECK